ncbi:hypothetical protein ADICYQ_5335 [Cyclobacterium qasimii M12-11B]|uniref:Uncharacterized protein n=1 Tax=Cyclobacterium qasimii M12-11B TaxID=641524 RepID=S7WN62_9BACT|nr:hypothetical protein ADICYQ_5335 [Cyclobacterium qasimii M12-11B]
MRSLSIFLYRIKKEVGLEMDLKFFEGKLAFGIKNTSKRSTIGQ